MTAAIRSQIFCPPFRYPKHEDRNTKTHKGIKVEDAEKDI
jgi:hypothetical protein